MVYRMSRGSSIDALAGLYAVSRPYDHMIQLSRPLLTVQREELHALGKEAGLEWLEDITNLFPHFSKRFIRQRLREDPVLVTHLQHLQETLSIIRETNKKKS